jgi:hypothetical protein
MSNPLASLSKTKKPPLTLPEMNPKMVTTSNYQSAYNFTSDDESISEIRGSINKNDQTERLSLNKLLT